MRARAERLARRWWSGKLGATGVALDVAAAPLSWGWGALARRRARRRAGGGARIEGLAVVSVGNLAVGGTGKTPVAAWVAAKLVEAGAPTMLLTGARGADEALLHRRWTPGVPVLVDRDRASAAARARAEGAQAVVLDDGFQHFALARDLDVVLLSADDSFPGPVLPGGPYRETLAALERAHLIVVTWREASEDRARAVANAAARLAPETVSAGLCLAPGGVRPLASWVGDAPGGQRPEGALPAGPVLAVCGVARPEAFRAAVGRIAHGAVDLLALPDHHAYGARDVERVVRRAAGRPIVVTEKDAVKLSAHASRLGSVHVLMEQLCWGWGEEALTGRIEALLAEPVGR